MATPVGVAAPAEDAVRLPRCLLELGRPHNAVPVKKTEAVLVQRQPAAAMEEVRA